MHEYDYAPWGLSPSITVHETERPPQATGILDANGVMLYRVEKRFPFGFQPPEPIKTKPARKRR